jgi:hypothetical protein
VAWYNHATKKAGFDVAVNGTVTKLAETSATLTAPMRFAFVLNSKEITALADEGDGNSTDGSPSPTILMNQPQSIPILPPHQASASTSTCATRTC